MSITPDILNDDCTSLDDWIIEGTITVSDGFKVVGGFTAVVGKNLSSLPSTFTAEIKTNFTKLGLLADGGYGFFALATPSWIFQAFFTSDGLIVYSNIGSATFITGADVKHDATAEDQIWMFQVNKTIEATSTVEVFLKGVSLGKYGAGIALAVIPGIAISLGMNASGVDFEGHFKSVKIGTGLGAFAEPSTDRYWIGNTGLWTDTAHWSLTSGGVGGADVPTVDDDVYFDENSFTEAGQHIEFN